MDLNTKIAQYRLLQLTPIEVKEEFDEVNYIFLLHRLSMFILLVIFFKLINFYV